MLDTLALRRTTRVLQALLIVAAAYGGALAINSGLALWIEDPEVARTPERKSVPTSADTATSIAGNVRQTSYAPIFERNLFGSEPLAVPGDTPTAVAGHGDLLLKGTADIDNRGFAVFASRDTGKQDVFEVGERVFNGPKLVGVQPSKAIILSNGRRITLEITEEELDLGAKSGKGASTDGAPTDGIKKTGEGSYLVDRREIDHSIENLSTVITKMRAVPFIKDGESQGFRVFNIKPNSIFERMGLKNGDVIQNVNGNELRDPARALSLLDEVGSANEIRIDLLRNHQPNTLTYLIR